MKAKYTLAVIAIAASLAWQVGAQPTPRWSESGPVGMTNNPLRMYAGQVMDFSPAIKWYQSDPNRSRPSGIASDSPLHKEMERRKQMHTQEGEKWKKYLVPQGSSGGRLAEGVIITGITVTKSVPAGFQRVQGTKQSIPVYKTVQTSKEVLLKNAPENLQLPIFAFPTGASMVGNALLESYDYGKPLVYGSPANTQAVSTNQTQKGSTNGDSVSSKKAAKDAALLKHYQKLAVQGDAYGLYQMGARYLKGDGVEQDAAKARELLQKAVSGGNPDAGDLLKTIPQ